MDDEWYDEEEDDEDYPYGSEEYECQRDEDWWEDDDYYLIPIDYAQGKMNIFQRAWDDFTMWVWNTRLYRKWSDWKYRRNHGFDGDEIPF